MMYISEPPRRFLKVVKSSFLRPVTDCIQSPTELRKLSRVFFPHPSITVSIT